MDVTMSKKEAKVKTKEKNLYGRKDRKAEKIDFSRLTLTDVICPVCISIMIEPVTMPCQHSLCISCFKENVALAALACPLCRKRISVWLRRNKKTRDLINEPLWQWIKETFKEKVEAKLQGNDDSENESFVLGNPLQRVCAPGEIRQEYEDQVQQIQEEDKAVRNKEEKESEIIIRELQEAERQELQKIAKERDAVYRGDLQLAMQLQEDKTKLSLDLSCDSLQNKLRQSPVTGPMDLYLGPKTPVSLSKCSLQHIKHSTPADENWFSRINESVDVPRSSSKSSDITTVSASTEHVAQKNGSPHRFSTDDSPGISSDLSNNLRAESSKEFIVESPCLSRTTSFTLLEGHSPEYPLANTLSSNKSREPESSRKLESRLLQDITSSYSSESDMERDSDDQKLRIKKKSKKGNKENVLCSPAVIDNSRNDSVNRRRRRDNTLFQDDAEKFEEFPGFHYTEQKSASKLSDNQRLSVDNSISNLYLSNDDVGTSQETQEVIASVFTEGANVDESMLAELIEEQKAIERRLEQEKQDRLIAIQLEKDMKKIDRSKGSEGQYSLRSPVATSSSSPGCKKHFKKGYSNSCKKRLHNDTFRQTTIMESLTKRQRRL